MNFTKLSAAILEKTIFEQEEEKRGIPLYQTWHIVNSVTLYHITSHSILSYHMVSHPGSAPFTVLNYLEHCSGTVCNGVHTLF